MVDKAFNTLRFLDLPYEIRKNVYYHLDGVFTNTNPPKVDDLYTSDIIELPEVRKEYGSKKRRHYFRAILKKFYPIFKPYLHKFQYSPFLIESWLDYSQWLRYDAIVLDCLRLNHLYDGSLLGPLDWILLDDKPKIAYFNNLFMLQIWYSFQEFKTLVLQVGKDDVNAKRIPYVRLNLENQDHHRLQILFQNFKNTGRFLNITEVFIANDTFLSTIANGDCINQDIYPPTKKRSRTPDSTGAEPNMKERYQIPDDKAIVTLIDNLENMKALVKIGVRGAEIYEALLNTHGVRDNPGQTISYLTRRQIKSILLSQVGNPSITGLADFSKWVNLKQIIIENCGIVNLNLFVMPPKTVRLIIRNIRQLQWWDFDSIKAISKCIRPENLKVHKSKNCSSFLTQSFELDRTNISLPTQKLIKTLMWEKLGMLNYICISDVLNMSNDNILIPKTLFDDRRVLIFSNCNSSKIILV